MPPFSGKKKKEQLKAKRAKKREQNERERAYESAQDALAEAGYRGEDNIAIAEPAHEAQAKNNSITTTTTKEEEGEYKYGADRAGVRSVFKKESAAAIAARKQASYEPLRERQVMPETGIAYGAWFHMPHVAIRRGNTDKASETFPVSLELPSRGWEPIAMDAQGKQVIRLVGEHNNSSSEGDDDEEKEEENEGDDGEHSEEKEEDDVPREEKTRHVTAAEIEAIETRRFARYVHTIEHTYTTTDVAEGDEERQAAGLGSVLSSYERNLEVWRQLWRTVEVSEVIVLVMDVRYPIVHLHLGLLAYVLKEQRKPCVLLLNKIDLVPQPVVERWLAFIPAYLQSLGLMNRASHSSSSSDDDDGSGEELPEVVLRTFTANPRPETASGAESTLDVTRRQRKARRRRGKMYEQLRAGTMRVPNAQRAATREKRKEDSNGSSADEEEEESEEEEEEETYGPHVQFKGMDKAVQEMQKDKQVHRELRAVAGNITELLTRCKAMAARQRSVASPLSPPQRQATLQPHTNTTHTNNDAVVVVEDDDAAFTHIGFVGFPNVGKSSLLNCIRGTKVVSVSATPGHTKHLQTIPLPKDEVTLVDSPGLALPMRGVPIPLQAVIGTHQIAQTRDPQSGVAYLAMHLPLEKLYGLRRPGGAGRQDEEPWSAYELCEAYAQKRGFFVKHGKGALDIHRASIALLQEAYEGRLVLFFAPPPRTLLETAVFARSIRPYLLQSVLGTS